MQNSSVDIRVIRSLNEYIDLLREINADGKERWFRGQSCAEYRLIPSAIREIYAVSDWTGKRFERPVIDNVSSDSNNIVAYIPVEKMVNIFKSQVEQYIDYTVNNEIEWECIAQHYGLPTRMLDWSTNPLDALYFAVCDCNIDPIPDEYENDDPTEFSSSYGAVFIIDPLEVNTNTLLLKNSSVVLSCEEYEEYEESLAVNGNTSIFPVCIRGPIKEKRICRQSGNFCAFGRMVYPLDFYNVLREQMIKILIPYSEYDNIRNELKILNITHDTIYVEDDEKDRIAKEIATKISNEFRAQMNPK